MLTALRYYWRTAAGYRLCPWRSPYIRWRFETFYGGDTHALTARQFFRMVWRDRRAMREFLRWVAEREHEQGQRS